MSAPTNFQAAIVSEKSIFSLFPIEKPVTKFYLAVKTVKVTPGSSFEQFLMGWSPQCYIPSFIKIGPPFLGGGEIFEEFLPYMGVAAILVM